MGLMLIKTLKTMQFTSCACIVENKKGLFLHMGLVRRLKGNPHFSLSLINSCNILACYSLLQYKAEKRETMYGNDASNKSKQRKFGK